MTLKKGLANVEAVESSICYVDGIRGKLYYRGYPIEKLVKKYSFEEIIYLLWFNEFPTKKQLKKFKTDLIASMHLDHELLEVIRKFPKDASVMSVLRTCISYLGSRDSKKDPYETKIAIMSKSPAIVAAFYRISKNKKPLMPKKRLGFAGNFLYLVNNKIPLKKEQEIFDLCLSLHAEHELNASTFSARVTASTLSDLYSCITSAIGTLKGPLHGGANERVYDMLQTIPSVKKVKEFVREKLRKKEKIYGFGHRVYKTFDPRVLILKDNVKQWKLTEKVRKLSEISYELEKETFNQKGLYANIDFFTALVYYRLGLSKHLYTSIFAIARNAGWLAHIEEQYANNKLLRPRAHYTGKLYN